ncbi:copper resistance CopC family protein [Methylocystis sp. SC2]|uniref:copper resistance CopC family protein n=1 Tax=Methylocystis sp. (strain SC2) TaxID=187303 RepID=UPI00027AF350|nr:copper resistance CopC family protein [Methylocystis sp. SC2]CCJ08988.1 Copper resistance protein CopC [Methylocystis sp. SC2]
MTNDAVTNADRTSPARARRLAGFGFPAAAGACASVIVAAFGTSAALAHSFLVDATPSSKEHVAAPPKTIKLRFGGGVEPPYSKITIETPDGKVLAQGNSGVPEKPRELSANAPELAPGKYIVRYRVLSTDGHIVEGNYEFTVDAK